MPVVKVQTAEGKIVKLDQIRQPIFDTLVFNSTSVLNDTKRFFDNTQGKKPYLTNLKRNSSFEKNVSYRVQGLALDCNIASNTAAALNELFLPRFIERSSLIFKIGEKNYWEGAARYATGRLNVFHAITGTATAGYHFAQMGAPAVAGIVLSGKDAIDIPELQTFYVDMNTSDFAGVTIPAGVDILMSCSIKGLMRRPVQ